jgi:hypothetical protein
MTNLQTIKSVAKKLNLKFAPSNATINGAKLYNFKDEFGQIVAANWTVSSAIGEYNHGDLVGKIS